MGSTVNFWLKEAYQDRHIEMCPYLGTVLVMFTRQDLFGLVITAISNSLGIQFI